MPIEAHVSGGSSTPFGSLFLAVFNSILEVVLVCAAGYILASKGILDKKDTKAIKSSKCVTSDPGPSLLEGRFVPHPRYFLQKLKELWVIPIYFTIVTLVSMGVGSVLGRIFKLRRSQRSFVMAAAMFMNSNSLPIALMQSLVVAVPELMWGPDDSKNIMLGRALTYLTMYSTLGMVIRYSYGIRLLSRADTEVVPKRTGGDVTDERTPLLADLEASTSTLAQHAHHSSTTIVNDSDDDDDVLVASPKGLASPLPPLSNDTTPAASIRPMAKRRRTTFYNSFPNSPNDSRTHLGRYDDSNVTSDTEVEPEITTQPHRQSRVKSFFKRVRRIWEAFSDFMTVSLWAALFSLLVACIPPLQYALTHNLQPVNGAINSAGKCAVPLTLIVLGAYFYTPPPEQDLDGNTTKRPEPTKPNETKTVILAVAARMIVTPVLILPLMVLATRYDFHRVFDDPVFVVCNIILLASPPALTLAQITQAVSGDSFERLISRTIFWSYCICTPPITIIYVVLGAPPRSDTHWPLGLYWAASGTLQMGERRKAQQDLEARITEFELELCELKRKRNALLPISQLPSELLCGIVSFDALTFANDDFAPPPANPVPKTLDFCHVSHLWRSIILGSPKIWSYIRVANRSPPGFLHFSWKNTGAALVDMNVDSSKDEYGSWGTPRAIVAVVDLIRQYPSKFRSLRVRLDLDSVQAIFEEFEGSFDNLEDLLISDPKGSWGCPSSSGIGQTMICKTPRLRRLWVTGYSSTEAAWTTFCLSFVDVAIVVSSPSRRA
ncbi:hypothetical protein NMY22_g13744 [Coprinellus aureogranulatus]|nr:hypothetical protein NMY22_g13744 [Coprinellus aureogranulatus]